MNKKVLIITYYWPPSGGAGVQRWLKFTKYLPEFGWEPIIYTPENPEAPSNDESLIKDISPETLVLKQPIWEPYIFYKKFTGKKKNEKINAGFIKEKNSNEFLENTATFIRGNFFIPDARKFWIKPSIKYLINYLKNNKVDTIISTGPPHSMHLIALQIKKLLGVKWIADFRDPWTNIDFYTDLKLTKKSDRKHKKLERKVLINADCVVSVSKTWSSELLAIGAKRVETITNGFDTDDVPKISNNLDADFSILHIGSVNKDRNHEAFWKVLNNLIKNDSEFKEKLKIKFIGKVDVSTIEQIAKYNLQDSFIHIEYIAHDKVSLELTKAQVLYLPINRTQNAKGIIPGKIFEYLASKRPILTIGLVESDIADILKSTQAGSIFDFNDYEGISNYITNAFERYKSNDLNNLQTDIDKYSRKNLTIKLSGLLNSI